MKTRLIIVAAPSGAGKSTFVEKISNEIEKLRDVVTYTTRLPRLGESHGQPYYFISKEEFELKLKDNFFIEWAQVHTNYYGTSFEQLHKTWEQGQVAIMDVDIQGVKTFKSKFPDAKTIFILPPSLEELRRRVCLRPGGAPPDLEVRMKNAEKEIKEASKFDFQIVNDQFEESYLKFKKIIEDLLT